MSLLGRAIRISSEEQRKAEEQRRADIGDQITEMQQKLEEEKSGKKLNVVNLQNQLRELENKESRHRRRLRWIKIKPKLLTATWGALVPGAFFLVTAIVSAVALYANDTNPAVTPNLPISLITMSIGVVFICLILKSVEGVAITSEDTSILRDIEAFKKALIEYDEEKQPALNLKFETDRLPLKFEQNSECEIEFDVGLKRVALARNVHYNLILPKGLSFAASYIPFIPTGKYTSYTGIDVSMQDIQLPTRRVAITKIKTTQVGVYIAAYRLYCEGWYSSWQEFEIIVKESVPPVT